MRTSEITLRVDLDEDVVQGIRWQADEAEAPGEQRAEAMLLALWDAGTRQAMRIDLWSRAMTVHDMNDFVFQTLMTLADTYQTATGNSSLMAEIKIFASKFAERAAEEERRRTGTA